MTSEPLSAEDAALLYAQAPGTQLQIGALCFFEAEPLRDRRGRLRIEALRAHVEARLIGLPRFRQRIAPVLADLATPMWVDDADFDVAHHCRHVKLPEPGGAVALRSFMDRLLSEPMDLAHPLWDIHMVEGLDHVTEGGDTIDAVAVVVRAHHVMADGIALHAAAMLLLDAVAHPPRTRRLDWSPDPTPGIVDLTARALAERTRRQLGVTTALTRALVDPRRVPSNLRLAARLATTLRHAPSKIAPSLPFTRPIGRQRAFAWASVPMSDIVAIKHAHGVTVNEVVLAITTGAVRRMMEAGESFDTTAREPRALVPIGNPDSSSTLGNRFSTTTVSLPVGVNDPTERVRLIRAQRSQRSAEPAGSLVSHLFSIVDLVPPAVVRAVAPRVLAHQSLVNLAVSNIPGSRAPLYLWEARMLALHPFIDLVGNVGLIIGVLSYADDLGIGITVDPDLAGAPATIAEHLRSAAHELTSRLG